MARTVLIADPEARSAHRVAGIAQGAGYRVLRARTPEETHAALEACPISAVAIDEDLLHRCDLPTLLLRAQVLVLSAHRPEELPQGVAAISREAPEAVVLAALVDLAGGPRFHGPRDVVPLQARSRSRRDHNTRK